MTRWIEEPGRAWRSLVVAPMVSVLSFMTLALLVAAGMRVRGSTRPSNIDPGFEPGGVARV